MSAWAIEFATLTLRCTLPGAVAALEAELLPALEELSGRLGALGSSAMSWEQVCAWRAPRCLCMRWCHRGGGGCRNTLRTVFSRFRSLTTF